MSDAAVYAFSASMPFAKPVGLLFMRAE